MHSAVDVLRCCNAKPWAERSSPHVGTCGGAFVRDLPANASAALVDVKGPAGTRPQALTGHLAAPPAQTEGGARIAICEGDKKGFGVKFIKAGGKKIKAFKAGGCLGTSSFIGKPYNKSDAAIDFAWPSDVPQVRPPAKRLSQPLLASAQLQTAAALPSPT